ncbi:Uncharacterised protein [Legionella busanensis]|uniref:Membrane-associated HD superfamily hydrolase n=1 Tax=Legionella busanensis TaxID=190655 RepID=A0A378JNC5_9GAMM|nr:hypothetical protein [Legionella busanensis]STX51699.1 Uncharacterised protein [Legionella busanensis]
MPNGDNQTEEANKEFKKKYSSVLLQLEIIARQKARGENKLARAAADEAGFAAAGLDQHGNMTPYWEQVKKKAHEFTSPSGQASYVEWHTGIMDIFGAMYTLSQAKGNSPSLIVKAASSTKDALGGVRDFFTLQFGTKFGSPSQHVDYKLTVNDKGVLTTDVYINNILISPDNPNEREFKQQFDIGVSAWLKQRGFDIDKDGVIKDEKTGKVMTPQMFEEINKDDDRGLKAFFSGSYKLKIDQALDTGPTPPSMSPS